MSSSKILTALAILSTVTSGYACDGVWQPDTAGNWSTGFTCEPILFGDSATFGKPPEGPVAVNVDVPVFLTTINFQNPNTYTLSGMTIDLGSVTSTDPCFINVQKGSHIINAPITLQESGDAPLILTANQFTNLQFTSITESGATFSSVIFQGPGSFNVTHTDPATTNGVLIDGFINVENGANVTFKNAALVTGPAPGNTVSGVTLASVSRPVTVNSGVLNLINAGQVVGSLPNAQGILGIFGFVAGGEFILNGGTVNLINSGDVSNPPQVGNVAGVSLVIPQNLTRINGGTLYIDNIGTADEFSFGAVLLALSDMLITGGKVINNDTIDTFGMSAGAPGTITVGPQGTVAGKGRFISGLPGSLLNLTFNNSGTLIPGDPSTAGKMTISGTLTQSSSATFQANIINGNNYGQLSVTNVNLDGRLTVFGLPHFSVRPGDQFKIIDSSNGVTGTFSSVSMLNNRSYIPMVFYSPNSVVLLLNAGSFPGIQQSIFTSINSTNIRLEREMQHLRSRLGRQEVAFSSHSVEKNPIEGSSTYRMPRDRFAVLPVNTMQSSFANELKPSLVASQMQVQRQQQRLSEEVGTCEQPFNFYLGPIGSIGDFNTKRHQIGFSEWSAGALFGFDYAGESFGVGAQVEYERLHGHVHKHWGHFNVDEAHGSLYATYVPEGAPKLALNGIVGGGYDSIRVHRNTGFTGSDVAKGSPHASEFDALFGLEYAISVNKTCGRPSNMKFIPMANIQYIYLNIDGYREHSAGIFDLTISGQKPESLRSTLGFWATNFWEWTDSRFDVELDLGWQREYLDHGRKLHFTTPNFVAPSGTMTAVGAGRNTFLAGLDFLFTLQETYGIEASYDFEWNNLFTDHAFYLGFNVKF